MNFRLCKGIYNEPRQAAWKEMAIVNDSFVHCLEKMLRHQAYVGIATHDEWVIQKARGLVARLGIPRDRYEFQMLLGVRPELRDRIRGEGERLRVYVPFGEKWRAYCLRRFRENPQILRHVTLALFRPGS